MAIIKYHDGNQNLVPLGATGDHSHSLDSLGAAKKEHEHEVVTERAAGFMSVTDKEALDELQETVKQLIDTVGEGIVEDRIADAVKDLVTKDGSKVLSTYDFDDDLKNKLDGIDESADVNQNAFSQITVSHTVDGEITDTIIAADNETDNLTLVAGTNITLMPSAEDGNVTIVAKDTTYPEASQEHKGLMSEDDKKKLDGIAEGATKVDIDTEITQNSTNAVQSGAVYNAIDQIETIIGDPNDGPVNERIVAAVGDCVTGLSVDGRTITYTMGDGETTGTITTQDTTYGIMKRAYAEQNGESGLVPVPLAGQQNKFLRGDAQWVKPTDTTYSAGTGLELNGTTFKNTGVLYVAEGAKNGTIQVNTNGKTANVPVYGLGSAAYTSSGAYDTYGAADAALESAKSYINDMVGETPVPDLMSGLDSKYASSSHFHTGYASSGHTHTVSEIGAASLGHAHDDRYYTESEVDSKLSGYSTTGHTHTNYASTSTFDTTANGLVPYPGSSNTGKYLRGDGTWQTPYTHPTGSGNNHIPSGGTNGQYLKYSSAGTATWADPPSTNITVDSALSSTSTNPVQNKVVESAISSLTSTLNYKANYNHSHTVQSLGIQYGSNWVQVQKQSSNSTTIDFNSTYNSTPIVVASVFGNFDPSKIHIVVDSVSTTNFTIRVSNNYSLSEYEFVNFYWIAIGGSSS